MAPTDRKEHNLLLYVTANQLANPDRSLCRSLRPSADQTLQ